MKNISPYNQKGNPHGYWELYHTNGSVMCKCFYNNGKLVSYEEDYYWNNNELRSKKYYI